MIQPIELRLLFPIKLSNDAVSTTHKVWDILKASHDGHLERVKELVSDCYELIYAQYNYTPPIHFAVREGHLELVKYLLREGAHDPTYKIYPFLDSLQIFARDRNQEEIAQLLDEYQLNAAAHKFKGDNGEIIYNRNALQIEFERAVNKVHYDKVKEFLREDPSLALDENFFWSEGVMMMVAKGCHFEMVKLLMEYGAKVPNILKWAQYYYFEKYEMARFLLENGMNPSVMSWHRVTLLHDMAQKGNIQKAELLVKHGAEIDTIDEEFQSTPLGMAVRWGHIEMVKFLLKNGANPNTAGKPWATPLAWAKKKGYGEIERILIKGGAT